MNIPTTYCKIILLNCGRFSVSARLKRIDPANAENMALTTTCLIENKFMEMELLEIHILYLLYLLLERPLNETYKTGTI